MLGLSVYIGGATLFGVGLIRQKVLVSSSDTASLSLNALTEKVDECP